MSAALKRRFNIVILPPPSDMSTEMEIVKSRVEQLAGSLELRARIPHDEVVEKVCTIFRELRGRHDPGRQAEGKAVLRRVVHCRGHFCFSGQHGSGRQLRKWGNNRL